MKGICFLTDRRHPPPGRKVPKANVFLLSMRSGLYYRVLGIPLYLPGSPAIITIMLTLDGSNKHPLIFWKKGLSKHA